jgi:predicted NUDIX family phosphoesterase/deoxycytidine triphosphate deaminase
MVSSSGESYCLTSDRIRELILCEKPLIRIPEFNEARIQPSSFEPTLSSQCFELDTKSEGLFRPIEGQRIERTLCQLPKRQRKEVDISSGYQIRKGYSYLFRLNESVLMSGVNYIKSSPKSSFGRVFLNTRLMTDFNPCFDEIHATYSKDKSLELWLLVQPLAFNGIVHPGLSLNQLRFFNGTDYKLSDTEILGETLQTPLLFENQDGDVVPARHIIKDGLQLHLNLEGKSSGGIIGLRARNNPEPIDFLKGAYKAEDYFEPIKGNTRMQGKPGEHYLLSSMEILRFPNHLSAELRSASHIGLTGPLHFAGFIDNMFTGYLVFEVRSDEVSNVTLMHGMPVSRLDLFRTGIPDKVYGVKIGSNYSGQAGPRPSKFFVNFDFDYAARNYKKLDRDVLVQEAKILHKIRKSSSGFEMIDDAAARKDLVDIVNSGFFHSRYDCEEDDLVLQMIPYVLVFGQRNTVFSYVRAQNIIDYGDERLFGKHSIGVGGHIDREDAPDYLTRCIERELDEEIHFEGQRSTPFLAGTLMEYDTPVDRVHFGMIYCVSSDKNVVPKSSALVSGRLISLDELTNTDIAQRYETWSKSLLPHLSRIFKYAQKHSE